MKILITNDDGINSKGIKELARAAMELGDVYVVAPEGECSAMSQHISVRERLLAKKHDFPLPVKESYSVSGTPADCVKVALAFLLKEKPDFVFTGINNGYNAGGDIIYSGTCCAAMEALLGGVPAIAFSNKMNGSYETVDEYLLPIMKELINEECAPNEIRNVNFPGVSLGEYKGILRDRKIAPFQYYLNTYEVNYTEEGVELLAGGVPYADKLPLDDTDMSALFNGYISIGKVACHVL
ncbi:MAG: 5'/3'-nucleotidase SurE [Lachnospiraceae bacterium]|nr:5'/3'-nucleotidase SurE [Lachnospiraceae bacterium]